MEKAARSPEDVLKLVHEKGVEIIDLWFTDVLGRLKSFGITRNELEKALAEGVGFDGSSVEGFARIYESDVMAMPDPMTFKLLPWQVDGRMSGRLICDVLNPDGTPYPGDPRYVLRRVLERLEKQGFVLNVGPEPEYFYFKSSRGADLLDSAGYFDCVPEDVGTVLRQKTVFALHEMGIPVEAAHHEVAPSQHEIDLQYAPALTMADSTMAYRYLVKEVASREGVYATFMPKPVYGINGSGMHTHQSLSKDGKNAFFAADAPYHLSDLARHYLAGLLEHAPEITAVTNQWVNSYKRLVAGFEAPVYICWGQRNRSALVRVPMYKVGKEGATRLELRSPDAACNPYLAFAVMLAAGLRGIENKYALPGPVEEDIYSMTTKERAKAKIKSLPGNLYSAIRVTQKSELVRETLGDHIFFKFIDNKKIEWDNYRVTVSKYELEKYLPVL
jgi:glutamine synthetase